MVFVTRLVEEKNTPMYLLAVVLLALACGATTGYAEESPATATETTVEALSASVAPSSAQLESDLQRLPWDQFKVVLSSIPKLKADVDAYGPFGWQIVQANYRSYGWRRNIDKLDEEQKKQLAERIRKAKAASSAEAASAGS